FGCYKNEKYQESLAEKGINKKDYNKASCNVDAIEFDPNLRGILNYEFCGQRVQEFNNKMYEISQNRRYLWKEDDYEGLTDEQIAELKQLKEEVKERSTYVHVKIVHNDFMTFASKKHYDLILMNPPFANGDEHLMKAIQMQQENGGKILCILNAETLLNLYSNKRKFLMNTLNDLGAKIQFVDNGFSDAERQTDVRVALIYIDIPEPEH
ncbi:methyltransferase, partial [Catenibacterium sp. UBA627]|uniref:methyltransferase n=1 Tax=Catenibacterium sp. UBA627 TaxID=1946309 RepID=UPI00257A4C5F